MSRKDKWATKIEDFYIEDVGGRVLEHLAEGIYSDEAILREYVQNAVDAIDELIDAGGVCPDKKITIN